MKKYILLIFNSLFLFLTKPLECLEPRPPQYVVFAFDGSKSLNFWQDTRDFTKTMKDRAIEVPFTYFVNGVVFLKDSEKKLYTGPKHSAGQADISFGGTQKDLLGRIDQVNLALNEGHEIGSHTNGHFDGSKWSHNDWSLEFKIFNELLANVVKNNKLPPGTPSLKLDPDRDVIGFRAPYLGHSSGLWTTLVDYKYAYDTSRVAESNYWPKKINRVWNFPLAMLKIVDTNKKTLSMDYNFYVADTNVKPDPSNASIYRSRMFRTYMNYFNHNYTGNRAPVHIGHHFSNWNGGAYYDALKDFAKEVCGKAEVRCVTYRELTKFMNKLSDSTIANYQRGNFDRSNAPVQMQSLKKVSQTTKLYSQTELKSLGIEVDPPQAHHEE